MVVTDVMGQVERRLLCHCFEGGPNVYHRSHLCYFTSVSNIPLSHFIFQGKKGESAIQRRDEKVCKFTLCYDY